MKKIIGIIVTAIILLGLGGGIFYFLTKEDSDSTLTILEKQWIEDNKNTMQDFAIVNKIPAFTLNGEGIIYEYLTELEEKTGLEFNIMTYTYESEIPAKYAFMIVDKKEKNDVLVYQDNYVLVSKKENKILNLDEIRDMNIGVIKDKLDITNSYLNSTNTLSFTSYETNKALLEEFETETTKLDAIVLPKTMYLETIANKYNINYNITEMTKDYVIRLGDNSTLNNIIKKYFKKWNNESYQTVLSNYFTKNYFNFTNINNDSEVNFKSKQYKYGFVNNEPYDKLVNDKLIGINSSIIKEFSDIADIEITYTEYNNYKDLVDAFNSNKIDFFMNQTSTNKFDLDVYQTLSPFDEKIVIITDSHNETVVNSLNSLKNATVMTLTNTKVSSYLDKQKITLKKYKTLNDLLGKENSKSIIALDYKTYEMYSRTKLKNYTIKYVFNLENGYNYVIKDMTANETFYKYFNFYLSFMNEKQTINKVNYKDFVIEKNNQIMKNITYILGSILVLSIIGVIIKLIKNNKKKIQGITKENKLKYIDMLTSLKNRNYLNDNIESWDESEIYPQTIMIVDLNNIAYINDNYGHNEGDNVITEAANILIKNQLEQTEIIRTNGNEFLIYLVGYDEKQIVAYKRKLSKEFKELAHGFGAAVGYSMINDGLKTIDDAINEATLDMRNNKEETEV